MAIHRRNLFTVLFLFSIFSISTFKQLDAARPLEGEEWLKKDGLVLQSLQRGSIPSSRPSCGTHIPKSRFTLSEMNIAGGVAFASPATPDVTAHMDSVSLANNDRQSVSST